MPHGTDPRWLNDLLGCPEGIGPTGQFPDGSIGHGDEGQLVIATAAYAARRLVMVNFGTPVAWLGLQPDLAIDLARRLLACAFEVAPELAAGFAIEAAPLTARMCRVCGCTDLSPCRNGCSWVAEDLCSRCLAMIGGG